MRFVVAEHSRRFVAASILVIACLPALAQPPSSTVSSTGEPIRLDHVAMVIGVPGLPPNVHGTLHITPQTLSFSTAKASAAIERSMITNVAVGEETVETGGTMGFIARKGLPYGSGAALGTVTHKKVGLLSAEFRDAKNEYHGAVFVLRPEDVPAVQRELSGGITRADIRTSAVPAECPTGQVRKDTVRLAPIEVDGGALLPDEYRVLVYEHLIKDLKGEKDMLAVYRDGDQDPAAQCAEFSLRLHVTAFKKGNPVLRASTGPLGMFVGTTSLSYHLTARTLDGTVIDKEMKSSERKDADSLNVTKVMSHSIAKDLKKAEKQLRRSQMS